MIYIQISRNDNAVGFLTLAKSGPVLCLPDHTLWRLTEHLELLRQKRISLEETGTEHCSSATTSR